MPRQRALDGLRALAVTGVVLRHLRVPGAAVGFAGVDLFFVLSGYLITSLLLAERDATGGLDLRGFWLRRVARLQPALVVMVAVSAVDPRLFGDPLGWPLTALTAVTYTYPLVWGVTGLRPLGLGHTWSLAVEELFYLGWPAALIVLRTRRAVLLGCAVAALASWDLLVAAPVSVRRSGALYYSPPARVWELLAGCALAVLAPRALAAVAEPRAGRAASRAAVTATALVAPAGIAVLAVLGPLAARFPVEPNAAAEVTLAGLAGVLLVGGVVVRPGGVAARLLRLPPLVRLGEISYGVYLYHWVVGILVTAHVHAGPGTLGGLTLGLTVALAAASHRWLERPAVRWAHARTRRPVQDRVPAVAVAAP